MFLTPLFATHPTPRGASHFVSAHLPSVHPAADTTPSSAAHPTISPYALSPSFSHSCALFCAFLHSTKTQLFCFQSIPHSLPRTAGGGVCLSSLQPPPRLPRRTQRGPGVTKSARLPSQPSTVDCQPPLRRSSAGRGTRVTSHCHPRRRSAIIRKKLKTNYL